MRFGTMPLRLLGDGSPRERGCSIAAIRKAERTAARSFNERFWYAEVGYLYDVVDGERATMPPAGRIRSLAFSLRSPGARSSDAGTPVLETVQKRLLTPMGLRSLAAAIIQTIRRSMTAICALAMRRTIKARYGPG